MNGRALAMAMFLAASAAPAGFCTACSEPQLVIAPPSPEGTSFASDGQVFTGADSESRALLASAAHDLSCPVAAVVLQDMVDEHGKAKHVVDGCGRRAFYFWNTVHTAPFTFEHHAVLENVVPLAPPAPT